MRKPPQVVYPSFALEDSQFECGSLSWDATTLVAAAKEQGCVVFDLPLAGIDLSRMAWTICNMGMLFHHLQRITSADLTHPVILDDLGYICDGWHRIAKAFMEGRATVPAMRLHTMPEPDEIAEEDDL